MLVFSFIFIFKDLISLNRCRFLQLLLLVSDYMNFQNLCYSSNFNIFLSLYLFCVNPCCLVLCFYRVSNTRSVFLTVKSITITNCFDAVSWWLIVLLFLHGKLDCHLYACSQCKLLFCNKLNLVSLTMLGL